jgi:hypothetical protein
MGRFQPRAVLLEARRPRLNWNLSLKHAAVHGGFRLESMASPRCR